jgi:hypothetical protein
MSTQNISGIYKLFKYGYFRKSDNNFEPISNFYSGMIHYADSGYMSVILRFARVPHQFSEIVAYSGNYHVEGEQIHHDDSTGIRT